MSVSRYHPLLVSLHWIIAVLLIVALAMGTLVLEKLPNDAPEKIDALKGHMIFGGLILVLTLLRLVTKIASAKPPRALTGNPWLDKLSVGVHHGFYLFIILMAFSGIGTAVLAGLPDIVFGGSGAPLPKDFFEYPPRIGHAIIAKILMLLVVLHVVGAIYHQITLKDRLLARMWFGKRG
jgi:cytochrome b561